MKKAKTKQGTKKATKEQPASPAPPASAQAPASTAVATAATPSKAPGWWQAPAFTFQQYPDRFFEDDAQLAQFKSLVERGKLPADESEHLPRVAWEPKHIPALVKLARDRKLYNRNVSPEVPLRYLTELATPKTLLQKKREAAAAAAAVGGPAEGVPAAIGEEDIDEDEEQVEAALQMQSSGTTPPEGWTEEHVMDLVPIFNGIDQAEECGEILHRLLERVGVIALAPLETYVTDASRTETARSFAAETIKNICARTGDHELERRGSHVLQQALKPFRTNRREWNGFLVSMLIDLRAKEALPLIRDAYAAQCVDERSCGDYGSALLEISGKVDARDPLVAMCAHCNMPEVICRKHVQAENDRAAAQALQEGTALFNADKIREAFPALCKAVTCSTVLSDSIDGCSARFLRARCLMALNRFEEAASDCSELLHLLGLKDLWWRAKLLRAEAHRERGKVDEAVNDVVAVLDELPDNTEAVALMAQLAEKGQLSQQGMGLLFSPTTRQQPGPAAVTAPAPSGEQHQAQAQAQAQQPQPPAPPPQPQFRVNWRDPRSDKPTLHWSSQHPEAASLSLSENRYAFMSTMGKVDVLPFTEPQQQGAPPAAAAKQLRAFVLDVENCGEAKLDPSGNVLAATVIPTHSIGVWDMPQNASSARYVPLGNLPETPEKVRVGGTLNGGIVAASSGSKIVAWHWRLPEVSPDRGPHWLWGSGGPITAMTIDTEESSCSGPGAGPTLIPGGLSLFACARETKRSCVLDFDLTKHELRRTLLGLSDVVCDSRSPVPATACAVASCATHVAASTTIGELVVWERATGSPVFRVRELMPRPRQVAAAIAAAPNAAAAAAAASAAASAQGTVIYACCLSFAGPTLVCGLSSGDVVAYSVETHEALTRLCGTGEAVSAMSASFAADHLVVRVGYSRGLIATRRFPLVQVNDRQATGVARSAIAAAGDAGQPGQEKQKKKKKKKKKTAMCKFCQKLSSDYGRCGRCLKETYCSQDCQAKDWARHKLVCEPKELDEFHKKSKMT